ncbi:hypothetical protein MR942_09640 [bacterium]|nr:hypothetical protein [bacterium]
MKKPLCALFAALALLVFDAAAWLALWWAVQKLRSLVWLLVLVSAAAWLA